jgi:crotonobetainyl-CoA:carnitine CoA-transferase CaiB-like acyl-CoA transferase
LDDHASRLLGEAWHALTGEGALPGPIEVTGADDLLASALPVIPLATAAVGASMLAAARLDGLRRSGHTPSVELDTAHLACAVRSERYVRGDGQLEVGGFAPLSRFFRTADGWIRPHANYPWHRERLLSVLGTSAEPVAVAQAVSRWPAVQLENAIFEAGGCAAAVRTAEEWRANAQGMVVNAMPLLEMQPVGSAPAGLPDPAPDSTLPVSGLRVLDLTRVIAGPVCTRTLGALGADVLRIDSPHLPEMATQRVDSLAGKHSALLDLRQPSDRARFDALLAEAHVVVQGYRPGAMAGLGLSPEALIARHPGLIVVSLSAWAERGPWTERRGFDSLVQAASGIAVCEAGPDPQPGVLPAQLLDHVTGYLAAAAALVALGNRQALGRGWHARVSLAQTAAWLLRQPLRTKQAVKQIDPAPYQNEFDTPAGPIKLIAPPARLDGRPLRWPGPPAVYGADPPYWSAPAARR